MDDNIFSVCGNFLDKKNWEGPKHKIIAGDAIQYLKDCQVNLNLGFLVFKYTYVNGSMPCPLFQYINMCI
jgi:hypothetical protein